MTRECAQKQLFYSGKMYKLTSKKITKVQQSWRDDVEDVDWFDDESNDRRHLVNDDNLNEYLADEVEQQQPVERLPDEAPPDYRDEIPTTDEVMTPDAIKEVLYQDPFSLVSDAMSHKDEQGQSTPEVIGFDYINRHGFYAGHRIVEPHYTFLAYSTGNLVVVTFDRDVQDIRAFIVQSKDGKGGIQPNGVRYEGEVFQPKSEIMVGTSGRIG